MGVLDLVRGRREPTVVRDVHGPGLDTLEKDDVDVGVQSGSDADTLSLEARNEKEVRDHPDDVTSSAQEGVQKIEAAALIWGQKTVYAIYAWIWICFFMLAFQSSIGNNVNFYAYSTFSSAPQISTAGILSQIIGGVLRLPIAKTLNIWGRAEGFLVFIGVYLLGMIVIASCNGPNGYAAGYVLYWIGYDAIYFILDVFVADTSGLRNRAFAFGFATTPFIATAFLGPLAAQSFLRMTSWRWAYGAFCLIQPFVFCPLAFVFKYYEREAIKRGKIQRTASGRTVAQSIIHYVHEFDIIGGFLLMAAFVLFLLPFSMETYGRAQYKSATFIAMVVIGVVLFPVFAIWEKYFARVHFIRWELLKQRTVVGACSCAAVLFFSFYCWDLYYYYFVYVVFDLSVSKTGYMTQIYNVGSSLFSFVVGAWIRYTKHFKYTALCFGLPLMFLGTGLMIHYRGVDQGIGGVIGAQICIAFAGGVLVISEDMAVMASADHDGVPMMLSLIGLSTSVGGAIGYAVAAAINANVFPAALRSRLPPDQAANWNAIYLGGDVTQVTYPVGSPTRDAINYAWGQSMRNMSIAGCAILVLAIPAIAVWKNYNIDKKQNKGAMV